MNKTTVEEKTGRGKCFVGLLNHTSGDKHDKYKVTGFFPSNNDAQMFENLDFLEERRDMASVWLADYQPRLAQGYNRNVKPREFMVGDLVLWKAMGSMKDQNARKLASNWEGPYRVTTMAGTEVYYLEDMEERPLPQPCNVSNSNIKKYYP